MPNRGLESTGSGSSVVLIDERSTKCCIEQDESDKGFRQKREH